MIEAETTMSINGGPAVPLSVVKKVLKTMKTENVAADQLRLFIERVERLEEEKRGIADDVKDVYAEAKSNGYDVKTMRRIVRLRRLESHVRQESEALLSTYANALGLQHSFPL